MKRLLILAVLGAATMVMTAQKIRYVTPNGSGNGTLSWSNASNDLQEMINQSNSGDEIWVAEGIYAPDKKSNEIDVQVNAGIKTFARDNAFVLKRGVKVYGGFEGNETILTARDWKKHETILNGKQSYCHVVISADNSEDEFGNNACLDGFIIENGFTLSADPDPTTYGIIIVNNQVIDRKYGGGIAIYNSSPLLMNLVIRNNSGVEGAGIYMHS